MIRFLDFVFSLAGLIFCSPILFLICLIGVLDLGSPLFRQERMGRNKKPFVLIKFRTMSMDTVSVASHLASRSSITRFGAFLRRTKLDELPQLWNVLKGDMSIVGPRPNLFSQHRLIRERDLLGIYNIRPGITGLAQINRIDMSKPVLLARKDNEMISSFSTFQYLKYIFVTILGKGFGDRIRS